MTDSEFAALARELMPDCGCCKGTGMCSDGRCSNCDALGVIVLTRTELEEQLRSVAEQAAEETAAWFVERARNTAADHDQQSAGWMNAQNADMAHWHDTRAGALRSFASDTEQIFPQWRARSKGKGESNG
jgi:hypothetical protein